MSRSRYSDDLDPTALNLWRGAVDQALNGARGQAFLREMLVALDAMPAKRLIAEQLVDERGEVCAIATVGRQRGIDMTVIDYEDPRHVAAHFGIARAMVAEIEYENDEGGCYGETPEQRWERIRRWVMVQIKKPTP